MTFLRNKFNIKYGKPYKHDYRRKPTYKSHFHLVMYQKFKKYDLVYDEKTGNIRDHKLNKPILIFSFDEAAFQFVGNYVKVCSLTKPEMAVDSTKYHCKGGGFYSLTPEGNDYFVFMENSRKETIVELLKEIRNENPDSIIFILIDNFPSHGADIVLDAAKELNIELCFLPPYSPQLQPIEKIWYAIKIFVESYKINKIKEFYTLTKKEKLEKLKELVKKGFYLKVKNKSYWNNVLNNHLKRIIKKLHPRLNSEVKIELVN